MSTSDLKITVEFGYVLYCPILRMVDGQMITAMLILLIATTQATLCAAYATDIYANMCCRTCEALVRRVCGSTSLCARSKCYMGSFMLI